MSQNKPRRVRSDEKARMLSLQTLVLCARTVISSRGKHAFLVHYSQTTWFNNPWITYKSPTPNNGGANGFARGNDLLRFHPFPLYKLVADSCKIHPVAWIHKERKEASEMRFNESKQASSRSIWWKSTHVKFANFSLVRTYRDFITRKTRVFSSLFSNNLIQ